MNELTFETTQGEEVSGILDRPDNALALLVFGHGAGAGMRHRWMEAMARELGSVGIATFRYQFPYMEKGGGPPNSKKTLTATVRSAVRTAKDLCPELPLFAGGKSMGGRMTSLAQSEKPIEGVRGIVFFGFPLHPSGKPSVERAEHLAAVEIPMLFLQGTRDTLADLALILSVTEWLGKKATLQVVAAGDHSFHVLKSSGKTDAQILAELAETVAAWMKKCL